ncbi:MAG: VWA domain-containing protein [Verrucomicrobiales bacterium]|nr:VWA domain-containing protein [Verrucomicrobiales bacterium]
MTEIETSLRTALQAHPEDWSVRMLVVDKALERDAREEAAAVLLEAPTPPTSDEDLQRLVEIAEERSHDLVHTFVQQNPANAYGHQLLAAILEWMGEAEKSQQHLSVAEALGAAPPEVHVIEETDHAIPVAEHVEEEQPPPPPPISDFAAVGEPGPPAPPPIMEPTFAEEEFASHPETGGLTLEDLAPVEPPKQRGKKATAVMAAVIFHFAIFLIAALVVILPPMKDDPEIVAAIAPTVQKKQEMQKKNVVKQTKKTSASAAAAAPLAQLMRANAVAKIALPNVTKTSKGPLGIGDADFGGGGFGSGGGGMGSGASFFGGTSTGRRFLFVIDHSGSMRKNQVELRNNELEKALKSLKGVQYQVLLFAGGAYYASKGWSLKSQGNSLNTAIGPKGKWDFVSVGGAANFDYKGPAEKLPKAEWLSTTPSNVKRTMDIVEKDRLFYGTDWGLALDIGHRMDPPPDVIFFMSDGTGGNSPPPILEINRKFGRPPINTVAMQTTQGIQQFAEIAKQTKGSFTIVDKDGKPIDGFDYMKNPGKFKGRL